MRYINRFVSLKSSLTPVNPDDFVITVERAEVRASYDRAGADATEESDSRTARL